MSQVSDSTKSWMPFDSSRRSASRGRRPSASGANTAALEFLKAHEGKDLKSMSVEDVARLSKDPRASGENEGPGRWRRLSLNAAAATAVSGIFSNNSESRSRSISRDRTRSRDKSLTRGNSQSASSAQRSTSAPRGGHPTRSPPKNASSSRGLGAFVKSFRVPTSDPNEELRGSTHSNVDAQILNRLALRRALVSSTSRTTSKETVCRRSVTPSPALRLLSDVNKPTVEAKSSASDPVMSGSSSPTPDSSRQWFNRRRTESLDSVDSAAGFNRSRTESLDSVDSVADTSKSSLSALLATKPPKQEYTSTDSHNQSLDSIATDSTNEIRSIISEGVKVFGVDRGDLLEDFGPRKRSTGVSSSSRPTKPPQRRSSRRGSRRSSVGDKLLAAHPPGVPLTLSFSPRRTSTASLISDAEEVAGLGLSEDSQPSVQALFPEKKEEVLDHQHLKDLLFQSSHS